MPTPMRKYGMNKALPTNSRRDIKGLVLGMRRFTIKPPRKAPSKPSSPTIFAREALVKMTVRMKMNCMTPSSNLRKNQRPTRGKTRMAKAT